MNPVFALFAQAPTQPVQTPTLSFLLPAALMAMVVFMWLTSRSQKKREKRERENMFSNMSRNDRVQTIGGVIGTVLSVRDDEVVLKVDESTNTKMTFVKTSVQKILTNDSAGSS